VCSFTITTSVNCEKLTQRRFKVSQNRHGNGQGLSYSIVGENIDVEEGRSFHGWIATRLENKKYEQRDTTLILT